jgi:uncharacterized protein YegL
MTFERLWFLLLLPLPLGWLAWEWRRQLRHAAVILKALMLCAVILALAEPVLSVRDRKVAVAALLDTSASVTDADIAREAGMAKKLDSSRGSNRLLIIPFARSPRETAPGSAGKEIGRAAGPEGRGTNLETPVRQGLASLSTGALRRILLVTDGNENEGSVTRAAWQAAQLGVPIDTIPLAGRAEPKLKIEAVSMPAAVFTGEHFPVDLTILAPKATVATVDLMAESKQIGDHRIALQPGENRVRVRTSLNASGAIDLSGRVQAAGLGESRFENAVAVRRPRVVWVSEDPAGTEGHIASMLTANRFDFTPAKTLPTSLDDAQVVVLNNINIETMPEGDKQRLEDFVRHGGGALWIAGERNVYVDHKGAPEDALARTFPAKLAPPRQPEGTCVVLIIDKSSSMEGKKIELARLAAIGVVDNLKPEDHVGVLIFDNSFQWAVPIRQAEDKTLIKRLISGITPDGGTQIAPALTEAYRRITPVPATYRHVVLLTDGISEEGDSLTLARDAANNRVTISTVGLGQDVNRAYLEKIAAYAKGKSYFLNDPGGLEQLLLKDVKEHTGTTAIERAIRAEVRHPSELLDRVDLASAPPLQGYVRFEMKPTGDEILDLDGGEQQPARSGPASGPGSGPTSGKDPLLSEWQYGLGRAAIFASDAKSRWAADWVAWPGFDRLWTNVFRDLLPHGSDSEASARYDSANEEILLEYRLSSGEPEPERVPELYAIGPGDFRRPVEVVRISPGVYRGRVGVGGLTGLFRIRPVNESRQFPEVGLYRQESEMTDYGSNQALLKSISEATGGRFNPPLGKVFDSGGRFVDSTMRLWPGLLALAVILNLIELALRKWRGIVESLRRPAISAGSGEPDRVPTRAAS